MHESSCVRFTFKREFISIYCFPYHPIYVQTDTRVVLPTQLAHIYPPTTHWEKEKYVKYHPQPAPE